jgi:hypothetical protein
MTPRAPTPQLEPLRGVFHRCLCNDQIVSLPVAETSACRSECIINLINTESLKL